jgi:hypothetical protein
VEQQFHIPSWAVWAAGMDFQLLTLYIMASAMLQVNCVGKGNDLGIILR